VATYATVLRRGLPRTPGGEPWPPADFAAAAHPATETSAPPAADTMASPAAEAPAVTGASAAAVPVAQKAVPVRRGLPRTPGGEPWPPADFAASAAVAEPVLTTAEPAGVSSELAAPVGPDVSAPLPFTPTVTPGRYAFTRPEPEPEPKRYGPFTMGQWVGAVLVGGAALLVAAAMVVLLVRWLVSLPFMQDFLATYPGEYHLPESAPVGFPAWLNWQHFLNVFLMVLIIRSGLQVRHQKRPEAFWSPRWNKGRKISIMLWFHQSLDILWLVNGVIFVVLLFVSGQWMRIVPTSWEVFPNALSAVIQYISLDWPTENGWVNYNSIQQLTYFLVVFIAAPLAAITGVRMSGIWPKNAPRLSAAYPIEWARAVHFPTMIFFVLFIIVHVTLVFATGALRNLNHMYAAQGSTDPTALAGNWAGFWIFVASMVVIAAGWVAARPLVLAPIARLFGTVSAR
jgi:thiosulfate reductase cytochrome b subunit